MSEWNAALAAYDEELEVLEGLREEYSAFLRSVFESLGETLAQSEGAGWKGSIEGVEHRAEWVARPRDGSPVSLRAWTPRPWGGPPSTILVGLQLENNGGFAGGAKATRRRLLLSAVDDLDSLPGFPAQTDREWVEDTVICLASASMKVRPAEESAKIAGGFVSFATKLDEVVERNEWLATALEGLLGQELPTDVPKGLKWYTDKLSRWQGGWYVQIELKEPDHCVWVCARPPGQLVFAHFNDGIRNQLLEEVCAKRFDIEGESAHLGLLLDEKDVMALHEAQDVKTVQQRAAAVFTAYFRLVR